MLMITLQDIYICQHFRILQDLLLNQIAKENELYIGGFLIRHTVKYIVQITKEIAYLSASEISLSLFDNDRAE